MILTVFLQELKDDVLFLFLGSMVVATAVEWFAGKILERMKQKNFLYCFFWGIMAVVWIKGIYPKAAGLIAIILKKTGWVLTGILVLFRAFNIFISVPVFVRYDTRSDGKTAVYRWEQAIDKYFDDVKIEHNYPNTIWQ